MFRLEFQSAGTTKLRHPNLLSDRSSFVSGGWNFISHIRIFRDLLRIHLIKTQVDDLPSFTHQYLYVEICQTMFRSADYTL